MCSLYGYLVGAITFLYNHVVYCLCLLAPKVFTVYAPGAKAFVSITLSRVVNKATSITLKTDFYIGFMLFLDCFLNKHEI